MFERLYIVHWASASSDDNGNAKAFAGVHGVYSTKSAALKGLVECKEQTYDEIINNPDYDEEDRELANVNCSIYGSEKEEYFELDYFIGDTPVEVYITISEQ